MQISIETGRRYFSVHTGDAEELDEMDILPKERRGALIRMPAFIDAGGARVTRTIIRLGRGTLTLTRER